MEIKRTRNPSLRKPKTSMKRPTSNPSTTREARCWSWGMPLSASKVARAVALVESTFMITELVNRAATVVPAIME